MLKNFALDKFDIIIQAGQSNSDGTGYGFTPAPYMQNENVLYLNGDFTISLATEKVSENQIQSNYSLNFASDYITNGYLKDGRKLLILRCSVGGTGFLDNRWGLNDDLFLQMIEMIKTALELNENNRLIALLWHQGETDAILEASYETHYNHLLNLVDTVKTTFNVPNLPFIAGDFVQQWKNDNLQICKPVISAIKNVCATTKNGRFVNTDNLLSNAQTFECDDTIHFSRNALYQLGKRYFSALKDILES